jgi:hypothetical protein
MEHSIKTLRRLAAGVTVVAAAVATILSGCSGSTDATASGGGAETVPAAAASGSPGAAGGEGAVGAGSNSRAPSAGGHALPGRELVNPDANTVVLLYYHLAHLPLPIDSWVEEDNRVKFAPAPEKAAHREAVRAELTAAAASVQGGVGSIRLTMNANLSEYDPSYGEFTVRALSPSSVVNFDALGQRVALSFTNGRTAQIWHVPAADAQSIRDKITYTGNVEIDVLLRIADVLPGPGGGTITTDVVEYELRETQRGARLARVQLPEERR